MSIELEHRFGRNSRVREYWLAASEGFVVQSADGRSVGTVRQVVHERDGRAVALLVEARRGLVGTEEVVLEADVVEEVAPWRSTLVVPPEEVPAPEHAVEWPEVRRAAAEAGEAARAASTRFVGRALDALAALDRAVAGLLATSSRATSSALGARWPAVKAHGRNFRLTAVAVASALAAAVAELVRQSGRALVSWIRTGHASRRP
jgi:hypothetical protein